MTPAMNDFRRSLRRTLYASFFVAPMVVLFNFSLIYAQTSAISQGFQTSETNIAPGALMSFEPEQKNQVELANADRVNELAGVVGTNPLIELSSDSKEVQIITSGVTPVLVSSINGEVKASDKITASPIEGVGMKATASSQVVGTAQADFDAAQARVQSVTDKNGNTSNVLVGLVPLQVNVTYFASAPEKRTILPPFIQDLANGVAGREVSVLRIIISAGVLVLGFVSIAVLLYASVRSSIISIGRNPLSESAVHKSLFGVGLVSVGVLATMLGAVYLILKL